MKLTQERLHEVLDYDPSTGVFTWKKPSKYKPELKGRIAGCKKKHGYITIDVDGDRYYAHRLAFFYVHGYMPENEVDHINRVKDDNRISNLREIAHRCNVRNCDIGKRNTSGVKGVFWDTARGKWCSRIYVSGRNYDLGFYDDLVCAAKARWEGEKEHGFIKCDTDSSAYRYVKEHGGDNDC